MDAKQIQVHERGVNREIPSEIMEEILSRLPVKSLIRFRCVSRTWQSLISRPSFIRKHLAHASQPDNLDSKKLIIQNSRRAYFDDTMDLFWLPLSSVTTWALKDVSRLVCPFKDEKSDILFLGCCDGMLCVQLEDDVYLWNPAIKTSRKLPSSGHELTKRDSAIMGFGYDSMNNDYKVLKLVYFSNGGNETRLYSLNDNSWRNIGEPLHDLIFCSYTTDGVFVNGAIHWLLRPLDSSYATILSYDLSDEKYKELPLPERSPFLLNFVLELTVSSDRLCLLTGHVNDSVVFWMMKDYGIKESWTKSFTMPCNAYAIKSLYSSDGAAMMTMQLSLQGERLIVMRKKDGTILGKEFLPRLHRRIRIRQEVVCVESLISPSH